MESLKKATNPAASVYEDYASEFLKEIQSEGLFDEIRKICKERLENEPEYVSLHQKFENMAEFFLKNHFKAWSPDLNKNMMRARVKNCVTAAHVFGEDFDRMFSRVVEETTREKLSQMTCTNVARILQERGIPPRLPLPFHSAFGTSSGEPAASATILLAESSNESSKPVATASMTCPSCLNSFLKNTSAVDLDKDCKHQASSFKDDTVFKIPEIPRCFIKIKHTKPRQIRTRHQLKQDTSSMVASKKIEQTQSINEAEILELQRSDTSEETENKQKSIDAKSPKKASECSKHINNCTAAKDVAHGKGESLSYLKLVDQVLGKNDSKQITASKVIAHTENRLFLLTPLNPVVIPLKLPESVEIKAGLKGGNLADFSTLTNKTSPILPTNGCSGQQSSEDISSLTWKDAAATDAITWKNTNMSPGKQGCIEVHQPTTLHQDTMPENGNPDESTVDSLDLQ